MRLLFAIKSLNVEGGGAERVLTQVSNGLVDKGIDVAVLTFDPPGKSFYPLDTRVERIDLAVGVPGRPTPRRTLVHALPLIRRAVNRWNPDLIIGFMHSIYVPLAAAMLGTGRRLVVSEHIGDDHFKGRSAERVLANWARRRSVAMTVPSQTVRNEYSALFGPKLEVLPNPIDLKYLRGASAAGDPSGPQVILSVGRFMAQKNQAELIRAFSIIHSEFPDVVLRIIGDGELRPQLTELVEDLGLRESVQMPGTVTDVASEYARCSFVVVPSRYESFGLVTAEAQAAGRAVTGFADCVGTNELIQTGYNGLLLDGSGNRVAALAEGMKMLLRDQKLRDRLAAAGPNSVLKFSLPSIVDRWDEFARKVAYR